MVKHPRGDMEPEVSNVALECECKRAVKVRRMGVQGKREVIGVCGIFQGG